MTLSEQDLTRLSQEIENVIRCPDPLAYTANNSHYQQMQLKHPSAYYVSHAGQLSWFLGAAVKYILRRHYKNQYVKDAIKIIHCLRLSEEALDTASEHEKDSMKNFLLALASHLNTKEGRLALTASIICHVAYFVASDKHRATHLEQIAGLLTVEANTLV